MKKSVIAVFGALAFAACAAKADTVVWYTFDDLTPGDTLADGTNIVNKANPGTHDAIVLGLMNYWLKPDSTKMPVCTDGISESLRIFDPVSRTMSEGADRALRFQSTGNTGDGAFLQIPNDADMRPESFSVEAMVWFPKDATGVNNWNVIAVHPAKMTCANADAWGFRFLGPTTISVRFTRPREYTPTAGTEDTYDKVTEADNVSVSGAVPAINDGRWHHVAFTAAPNGADSRKTDVKVFFDYNQVASSTLDFRPQFSDEDDCPVWVGSTRQNYGFFTGAIGEFRLSNVALTPGEFLRSHDAGLDKDVVLYYDFETLGESGQIVNIASPGIMDGTIITNTAKSNLAPEFVEDTPVARIRQSLHETTWQESEKSLCNYVENPGLAWDAVNYCGYVKCQPLDTAWFSKKNFTVETFFMTTNNVQKWNSFFQRKGGWNVQFKMGISTAGGTVGYNITTNETIGQVEQQASSFTVGEWHHFAVVVDQTGESKRLIAYLDKKIVGQISLDSRITQNNISNLYDHNGAWFIAGGPGDCAFDGKLDSMRVTLRALEPDEFLTARRFPVGRTLAHVTFNDGTVNADSEGGTMVAGVNAKARDAGSLATFSGDVPGTIIRNGEGGEILTKRNTKSLSLSGSKVTWGSPNDGYQDTYYIRNALSGEKRTSWTMEFWMKTTTTPNTWSRIITASNAGTLDGGYAYALTFWEAKHFSLRGDGNDPTIDTSVNVCDGKWHHIAITYAPNTDYPESKSDVKFYIDYGSENGGYTYSKTTDSTKAGLVTYSDNLMFVLGMGNNPANTYDGLIDELRFSDVALEPSQFLRADPPGLSIVVR